VLLVTARPVFPALTAITWPPTISCISCDVNCASCTSNDCTQCSAGFSLQNDSSCLSVGGGTISVNINGSYVVCDPGCLVCVTGTSSPITCITAQVGYALISGMVSQCSNSNCMTCSPGTSVCTSCYNSYNLVSGSCIQCLDPNAISCLSTSLNYSTSCIPKYSAATSSTSVGGYCLPCAANCLKCDINGPGNCDTRQCTLGFVQLTGTLNCAACFSSCPVCDSNNPSLCLDCGSFRYSSSSG